MRHRRRRRAAELTPLLDVLFILLFASLVQTRHAAEGGAPASTPDAGADATIIDAGPIEDAPGPDAVEARDAGPGASDAGVHEARARRRAALIAGAVRYQDVLVVEVSAAGYVVGRARWRAGVLLRQERLHQRLLRVVPPEESDMELEYRGDRRPEHRICQIALASADLATPDLDRAMVVIMADAPLDALPRALRAGLMRDAARCFDDVGGVAILLDPADEATSGAWDGPGAWPVNDKEWNP